MSTPHRADWVDCARTLAMFCIVWLHADAAPDWLGRVVGGAIALFFLLAGYFMHQGALAVATRAWRLALAWGLWSLLSLGLMAMASPDFEFSWQRSLGWGEPAYNTPLWFLKTLVAYQLVLAGGLLLRVLPRYRWLLVVLFTLGSYTTFPAQYAAIRFDYFWIFLLGFALQDVELGNLYAHIRSYARAYLLAVMVLLVQPMLLAAWAQAAGLPCRHCNLPVAALAFMLVFLLMGALFTRYLPRVAGWLAIGGRWMLFTYAAHSFVLAPLYGGWNPRWLWNVWVPLLVLPLLTCTGWGLARLCPRIMAVLLARRCK